MSTRIRIRLAAMLFAALSLTGLLGFAPTSLKTVEPAAADGYCCGPPYAIQNDPYSSRWARVAPHPKYYPPYQVPNYTMAPNGSITNPAIPEARLAQIYNCAGCMIAIWPINANGTRGEPRLQLITAAGWTYFNGEVTRNAGAWVKYYY